MESWKAGASIMSLGQTKELDGGNIYFIKPEEEIDRSREPHDWVETEPDSRWTYFKCSNCSLEKMRRFGNLDESKERYIDYYRFKGIQDEWDENLWARYQCSEFAVFKIMEE